MGEALFEELAAIGRAVASTGGTPTTVYDRHGVLVVRVGDVVVKAHQADRENGPALARRMAVAAELPELLLRPLGPPRDVLGRVVTVWPYGEPVSPDDPPWEEGGRLLARLHSVPWRSGTIGPAEELPRWGRPTRVARLVDTLDEEWPETRPICRAFQTVPGWIQGTGEPPEPEAPVLIHGDWHLGQLIGVAGGWRMIDVEDLGLGDPAWDLARPAALYSAGVLPSVDWARLLAGYRRAGGPAMPPDGDLWRVLEMPARVLAIQIAATCVISARAEERPLDGLEKALVDACGRIADGGAPGER